MIRSVVGRDPLRPLTPSEEEAARAAGTRSCISKVGTWMTDAEAQTGLLAVLQSGSADIPRPCPNVPADPWPMTPSSMPGGTHLPPGI